MKRINKNVILLLAITFIISIISYINFVPGYFSIDTAKIVGFGYLKYGIQYSLYDGRIFMFLICYIAEIIKIDIKEFNIILLISSLFISSVSVIIVYETIKKIKPPKTIYMNVILFLISYCYIFHFMYIDSMQFAECIIMSMSVLFYIIAAKKIMLQNEKKQGFLFSLLGILLYRGTISIFITTSILFALINNKNKTKELFLKAMYILKITVCLILIDYLIITVIDKNIETIQSSRLNIEIVENILQMISELPYLIINNLDLFPKYLNAVLTLMIFIIIYVYEFKNKKIKEFYLAILILAVCYCSSLVLSLLHSEQIHSINGRVFTSFGASISALMIFLYIKTDIFKTNKIISVLVILYFTINLINTLYITNLLEQENNIDRQFSYEIERNINNYKEQTNKQITKFAICYIENKKRNFNDKKILRNMKEMGLYNASVYQMYTGKKLERVYVDLDIINEIFKENDTDMVCIEDRIYIPI